MPRDTHHRTLSEISCRKTHHGFIPKSHPDSFSSIHASCPEGALDSFSITALIMKALHLVEVPPISDVLNLAYLLQALVVVVGPPIDFYLE